ncbi:hypothetical protein PspLS_03402 [Pyricularia sp. CBS 133598]|nr:hypothetical protein PspLS_03402 [Pyricularia sp. CBS 133598]
MAPMKPEDWARLRSLERDRKRNLDMAYILSDISTSDDIETNRRRHLTMGYVLNGIHVSDEHEDFCGLSKDRQKQIVEAAGVVKFGRKPDDPDNLDLPYKWSVVEVNKEKAAVQVLEDSGTDVNWISRQQAEKLGLSIKATETLLFIGFTGHSFKSSECVYVPFLGKGDVRGQAKFYIAPPAVPVKMIVGRDFMEQHPGVLWDQQPPGKKVLLAIQPRMKA